MTESELKNSLRFLFHKKLIEPNEFAKLTRNITKHFENEQPEEEARGVQHQKPQKEDLQSWGKIIIDFENGVIDYQEPTGKSD